MSAQTTANMAILITIKGEDAPGITAAFTTALADSDTKILDIEQVVIHNLLTLSILIDLKEEDKNPLLKDLLFKTKNLNVNIDFRLVPEEETVNHQSTPHTYVITCLGEEIPSRVISRVTSCLYEKRTNIEKISKLAWGRLNCLEIIAGSNAAIPLKELTGYFVPISHESGVDIAVQRENLFRKAKRLVVMDMDSTLIQVEVIDELAARAGIGEKVSAITERAMNGEIDFTQSLRERVALLEGLDEKALDEVYRSLPLTSGAESLIKTLKQLGYKTAVISGGFDYFTERLKDHLGLDYAFANRLEIKSGKLTGRLLGDIIDGEMKAVTLEDIAKKEGFLLDQVIAIGDGANDLPMLGKAGLGIAFNAKKTVRDAANYSISQKSLDSILYLLGINEKELKEIN